MIKVILYDLDGVLVDAVDIHKRAFAAALKEVAKVTISEEEHARDFNGLPTKKKLDILVAQNRIFKEQIPFIERLKQEMTIAQIRTLMHHALDKIHLHQWAKESGIRIGCVTNSIRETAELMLERTGQREFIELLISNQDVANPKPDPEGYHDAMDYFNVKPSETLIVEDSPKGIQAARASGANVLVVSDSYSVNLNSIQSYLQGVAACG
jgi:beta-phosphoglucomutase